MILHQAKGTSYSKLRGNILFRTFCLDTKSTPVRLASAGRAKSQDKKMLLAHLPPTPAFLSGLRTGRFALRFVSTNKRKAKFLNL
jgi:hypothetical protein